MRHLIHAIARTYYRPARAVNALQTSSCEVFSARNGVPLLRRVFGKPIHETQASARRFSHLSREIRCAGITVVLRLCKTEHVRPSQGDQRVNYQLAIVGGLTVFAHVFGGVRQSLGVEPAKLTDKEKLANFETLERN